MKIPISKRTAAKEWLIFLGTLPFGCLFTYWIGYRGDFDNFWNNVFGLRDIETLILWATPYLAVNFLRITFGAIQLLLSPNDSN